MSYFPNHLKANRETVAAIDKLRETNPEKFSELMQQAYTYCRNLEKITPERLDIPQKVVGMGILAPHVIGNRTYSIHHCQFSHQRYTI